MNRVPQARLLSLAALVALTACSGGSDSTPGVKTGGSFLVLRTEPLNNGLLFLNDPIRIDFSNPVDLGSADLNTVTFTVLDQARRPVSEQVAGSFAIDASPGDAEPGRRLMFVPRLPTNNTFDNGGFRPGRTYLVQLVGGDRVNGTVLRDRNGRGLEAPVSFQFSTADGTTTSLLFRNRKPGGPRRADFSVTPTPNASGVVLNKFGAPPVEIRLTFDQALNPSDENVPVSFDTNPLLRRQNERGRIYLEYLADGTSLASATWIPADVEIEENTLDRAVVVLRPVGVLPNNATIRVIVEAALEDISGESNTDAPSYNPLFATFQTRLSFEPQFDAVVLDFEEQSSIDFAAPFSDPVADVGSGFVKAGFAFEGSPTGLDYSPAQDVVLNTDFTQIEPSNGAPFNVSGGVFNFRDVTIPQGVTVSGQGTNPMVWLVNGSFTVNGVLSVRGGDGTRVNTVGSADLPKAGGFGACGGGDGGVGSPSRTLRDERGGSGFGPRQLANGGGGGGRLGCNGCFRGSAGGGGSFATQGDPSFRALRPTSQSSTQPPTPPVFPTTFQQREGFGGQGICGGTRALLGGEPGPIAFVDSRKDNDFWGSAVRYNVAGGGTSLDGTLRIAGELSAPRGGSGGGGGGDTATNQSCTIEDPGYAVDRSGGGGGGGGGVLIVKAIRKITIGAQGRITADGGNGGSGESHGLPMTTLGAAGGGGGSGGMVVLMSAEGIDIHVKGSGTNYSYSSYTGGVGAETGNDYSFAISADGGTCTTAPPPVPPAVPVITGTIVTGKYPANGTTLNNPAQPVSSTNQNQFYGHVYDQRPLGGFGGMGIVQLMAPPGPFAASAAASADQTNTRLDDNIRIIRNGTVMSGTDKRRLLGWRGFPDTQDIYRDDFDAAVHNPALPITDAGYLLEGDIRPAPILLPVPYGARSRALTKWIDTGSSRRDPRLAPEARPKIVVVPGPGPAPTVFGPVYEFAGTDATGFAGYSTIGQLAVTTHPAVGGPLEIARTDANATFLGQPAYRVDLANPSLGDEADRYSQYEAELLTAQNSVLGSFRILSHSNLSLVLAPDGGSLPADAARVQVRARFYKAVTNGIEGLGPTHPTATGREPNANIRLGFAFHADPASASATRVPTVGYVYDWAAPGLSDQIKGLPFVQLEVTFDLEYGTGGPPLGPGLALPELRSFRLPFRF